MKPRDWFGVLTRGLGLWTFLGGIRSSLAVIAQQSGWLAESANDPKYLSLYAATELGVGLIMLLGADVIVRIAYAATSKRTDTGNETGDKAI
jgi:hypothetical protein